MRTILSRLKRPIESHNKIWLASIALTALTVVIAATVAIGKLNLGTTQYRAEFTQAASIRPGDQVTVAGIQVGTVRGLQLAGDRVLVDFGVRNDVHLGGETRAAIKLTTLLGSRYLELSPTPDGQLRHRLITLAHTSVPFDLQQALADATTTFEQIDADRIAQSLSTLSQSLNGVPEALPKALDNLKSLSSIMAARRDQIGSLLNSTDTVTAMIRDQQATLGSLVTQGRNLLAEVAKRREQVKQLLAAATTLVDRIRAILDDQPQINQLTDATRGLLQKISANDALLRNTLQILPVPIRNMTNATGSAMTVDGTFASGPFVDSWMCAISARAKQFNLPPYFQDCQPVPDPFPGIGPPPDPGGHLSPGLPPDSLEGPLPPDASEPGSPFHPYPYQPRPPAPAEQPAPTPPPAGGPTP